MILVTGATGFVGPHIVHALRAEGRQVRVLVREGTDTTRLATWGCELAVGDMTDPAEPRARGRGLRRGRSPRRDPHGQAGASSSG